MKHQSAAVVVAALASGVFAQVEFRGLGSLYQSNPSVACAVSGDGTVVGGDSNCCEGHPMRYMAMRWSEATGVTSLSDPYFGWCVGASYDGAYVVGGVLLYYGPQMTARWRPYRANANSVRENLDPQDVSHWAISLATSADGQVVVGYAELQGMSTEGWFRWTPSTGFVYGAERFWPIAISADGVTLAGSAWDELERPRGFIWTASEGGTFMPLELTSPLDISPEGRVLVGGTGKTYFLNGESIQLEEAGYFDIVLQRAFRWVRDGEAVDLGLLPGLEGAVATGTSQRGRRVIGFAGPKGQHTAFIWDFVHGMRPLRDVLIQEYGLTQVARWQLNYALGISDDGSTIVGAGLNPQGVREAWLARIPPVCDADFDQDGFVTGLDFDAFILPFEAGAPAADFDVDGFVTGKDFDAFVSAFESGC